MDSIASAVITLADRYFGDYKIRNGQVIPKVCPLCKGGSSGDRETFSVGLYNGCFSCLRGNCTGIDGQGKKKEGTFTQLANFFGEAGFEFSTLPKSIGVTKKRVYDRPDPEEIGPLTDEIIKFFSTRMISEQTLNDWKIGSDKNGNILFPFYRDGILTYVKHRAPKKYEKLLTEFEEKRKKNPDLKKPQKEWQDPNTEPILYGMDNVSFNMPLVITEGQIDALSVYEAGYSNVVSVPCGCNNLEWITSCWDWLEKFQQIILFGDADEPGMEMTSILMKRLGEDRCMVPKEYPELIFNGKDYNKICKDANEILCCYGPDALKAIIKDCEPVPIKGLLDVASIPYVDPTSLPRIMTKIPALDQLIGGLNESGITVISGRRGDGKSTIGNSILLNAIQQDYNCCVYSGELTAQQFKEWLYLTATESKYIGYKTDPQSGKNIPIIDREIANRISEWLTGKMKLFDNSVVFESDQQTAVLKCFEMAARRYGCKLFLIDNLMSLLTTGDEENRAQAKFMATVKAFAAKYKVHVLCVCHPRKEKEGSTFTNDTVSGSSVLTNLADNVWSIERPNIRVTKNRSYGATGYIMCDFDPTNRRIFQASLGDRTVYGWDHTGIKEPENPAVALEEFQLQHSRPEKPNPF